MAKIRSSSTNMGVLIKENGTSTYGADPGTWTSGAYRVPFTSCDIKVDDEILPESGEYTALGAASRPTRGRRLARGSTTVEPVYDGAWFWLMFGHGFSTEDIEAGYSIEEGIQAGLNTHVFDIGGGITQACDIAWRNYKNSWYESYFGMTCVRWVLEHNSGSIPTLTQDWIGIANANPITFGAGTDFSGYSAPSDNRVKLTDLGRTDSDVQIGSTQAEFNVTTVRIIGGRAADADDPEFLQNLLTAGRPGQQTNRDVSLELEGTLQTTDASLATSIMNEYLADTLSKASIGWASSATAAGAIPYQFRFDFPSIAWTAYAGDMTTTGLIPWSATGLSLSGATSGLSVASGFDSYSDGATPPPGKYPASGNTDCRLLVHVADADDGTGTAYTTLGASS